MNRPAALILVTGFAAAIGPPLAVAQEALGRGRTYLDRPTGGPDWGVRFVVTLLYPR